jgi:hypothetical protein
VPLTVYGDRHDKPLTYSELVSGERTLGKLWGAPWAERIAPPIVPPIAPPAASAAGAAGAAGAEEIGSGVARWLDMDVVDTTFMQVVEWSTHPYAHSHAHAHYAHAGGAARGRPRGRGEPQAAARALCDQPAHGRRPVRAARHTSYRAAAP